MKYAGIAGLLAVVTAVTGAAIPKVDLSQATESEVAQLQKELADVQNALDAALEKDNQKRGIVGAVASGVPVVGPVVAGVAGPLKRGVVTDATGQVPGHQVVDTAVDTAKGVTNNVPVAGQVVDQVLKRDVVGDLTNEIPAVGKVLERGAVGSTVGSLTDSLEGPVKNVPVVGQVLPTVTGALNSVTNALPLKRDGPVGGLTQTLDEPLNSVPAVGPVVGSTLNTVGQTVDGAVGKVTGSMLKRDGPVGGLTQTLEEPLNSVPAVGPVVGSTLNTVGQTVDGAVGKATDALPLKRDGPVGGLTQTLEEPLNSVPAVGPVVGSTLNTVGQTVDGAVGKATNALPLKRDGPVSGLTESLGEPLNSVPAVGPVVGSTLNTVGQTVDGVAGKVTGSMLKRDDPISQLAGNLLPQLNNLGVLPEGFGVQQLTGLLQTLNAKGLVGNVEQLLGGLLNGGLLKTVSGLLPVKRDDAISQLAGSLLPELLQNNVLSNVGADQLTTLLQTLNVNGLLQNVESVLGGGLL